VKRNLKCIHFENWHDWRSLQQDSATNAEFETTALIALRLP
jgi:hypothetical protein